MWEGIVLVILIIFGGLMIIGEVEEEFEELRCKCNCKCNCKDQDDSRS